MLKRFRELPLSHRAGLLAWLVAVGVLAVIGLGVGERLHRTEPSVPGTPAARAQALSERSFGPEQGLVVLLEGPPRALRAAGPAIARRVASVPHFRVLDPWRSGARALQPRPGQAILLVSVGQRFEEVSRNAAPRLRSLLGTAVRAPLSAHMSGYPDIANAIHRTTVRAVERAELIAAPALLVVLILVLGSPVAASVPLFLGGCTVAAGTGVLELLNRVMTLDAAALNLTTMIGLALGVDYSLLLLTRFRSELADGHSVAEAADRASARAGRTVRFAAAVLALAMIGALLVVEGHILRSAAVGALVAVGVSAIGARIAIPALLRLAGHGIDRGQLLPPGAQSRRWGQLAMRVLRRPALAGGVVVALLLAVSAPALGLETGPPSPLTLPGDSAARKDFDVIDHAIGGSRTTPFVVTVVARHGTLAGARRAALAGFERRVQGDPRTLAVLAVDPRPARAARILVVQRKLPTRAGNPYRGYLEQQAALLGRQTGSATAVGGPAASLADFDDAAKGNLPLLMVMLVVVTYAGLVPLMRSLVLPLIAVVLNVLTVLAAFGVLALAFGPSHPLGGPGFVDDIMVDIVFSVVLALSIDYQIFILDRMREGYVATGTVEGAIAYGLQHTAGVITGAAAIMLAVFLAFAISPVVTMSELGLGLSVAVALDATLVRLVLLPAALRLAGPRAWGWPAAFDRLAGRPRQSARAT